MDAVLDVAKTEVDDLIEESGSTATDPSYQPRAWDRAGNID